MNNKTTKLFAVFAVALMLLSAGIPLLLADADSNGDSYKISDDYITPVKNQQNEGLCWAFAISSVLETEMIVNNYYSKDIITSPLFVAVNEFDGYEKDYKGGDYNGILETGTLNTFGGTLSIVLQTFMSNRVPVEEYLAPYSEKYVDYADVDRTIGPLTITKGATVCNPYTDMDQIKSLLKQNHSAVFSYYAYSRNSVNIVDREDGKGKTATCNLVSGEGHDSTHAVQLVGWDDNYPKENFTPQPKSNGAWLIKNSWGTEIKGQTVDGYNWISYEHMIDDIIFITHIEKNDGNTNSYSYDHGYSSNSDIYRSGSATMANVYVSERNENLNGVSMTLFGSQGQKCPVELNYDFRVKVYKLGDGFTNPTDGTLAYTSDWERITNPGSPYVKFDESVHLEKGQRFSICIECRGDSICLPVDTTMETDYCICHTVADKGQSYLSYNGQWTDISADGKSNFRIKAYTQSSNDYVAELMTSDGQRIKFGSLQEAVDAASIGDTVRLLRSTSIGDTLVIRNKNMTLDLRGFQLSAEGKNVISVKDSKVLIQYGKISSTGGSPLSSLVAYNSKVECYRIYFDSSTNGIDSMNNSYIKSMCCTFDYSKTSSVPFNASAGSEIYVIKGYQTSNPASLRLCDVDASSKITLNLGYYTGSTDVPTDSLVILGGHFNCDLEKYVDKDKSNWNPYKYVAGANSIKYATNTATAYTSDISEAIKNSVDGKIVLCDDITITESLVLSDLSKKPIIIDLNGHSMNSTATLFSTGSVSNYYNVTFTNSSSNVSVIGCRDLGHLSSLNIGPHISVEPTTSLFSTFSTDPLLYIDPSSDLVLIKNSGSKYQVTVPFVSDGMYCESITIKNFKDGKLDSISAGISKRVLVTDVKTVTEYDYTVTHSDGTKDTIKETSTNSGTIESKKLTTTTKSDGTVTVLCKYTSENELNSEVYLTKGGKATITCGIIVNPDSGKITRDDVSKWIGDVKKLKKEYEQYGCTDYNLMLSIFMPSTEDLVVSKEAVELLSNEGIGLKYTYESKSISVSSKFLSEIHGDLGFRLDMTSSENTTSAQRNAIHGTMLVYDVVVTVDGERIRGEFPSGIEIEINTGYHIDGLKVFALDSNGKGSEIESVDYDTDSTTVSFSVGHSCSLALCEEFQNEPSGNNDSTVIAIVVIMVIVLGCGMFVIIAKTR